MRELWQGPLEKIGECRYKIPKSYKAGMNVDGLIFADGQLLEKVREDRAADQVANVAFLPGIVGWSLAMPDIHWGYGFPIGGVAAFDLDDGVISPGGVGYDINCGVRLLRTDLEYEDIKDKIEKLIGALFSFVPSGVGSTGKIRISDHEVRKVLTEGVRWALAQGYGWPEDLDFIEEQGALAGADPDRLSARAIERGRPQLGTLGAGNHFLEIQVVEEVFDAPAANVLGLFPKQIVVMIHTGSRGLGYQVCDDSVKLLGEVVRKYGIKVPDRQLACAPIKSPEGRSYFAAMACAANYAWVNRQAIMHWIREAFEKTLEKSARSLGMSIVYDVAHNIAKFERHTVHGHEVELCVHRKGATRAFAPGHPQVCKPYQAIGQPVLIPGDMGTHSYVLLGTDQAMKETFGSTCHGAGRLLSRTEAIRRTKGRSISRELQAQGIYVLCANDETLHEEVSEAYKDVDAVVDVCQRAGISKKVAKLRPVGVVKG